MKLLLENWKEFLTEENDELSEMATAWKERGLAGPYKLESGEMGSTLDVLKQYVTPDNEKPTHFIHFGGVGHRDAKIGDLDRGPQFKFGINPRSTYNTPTGIYAFPLSDEIYRQLENGDLPFAQDEPFIMLFKPKETLPIIYTSEDIPDDEYREYIEKLFSQEMIDAEFKGRMKTSKVAQGRGWEEVDVRDSLEFLEKGKKEIEELSTKGTWATKSRNSNLRWEKLAKIPQQFFGKIVNRAIRIYAKKAYGANAPSPEFIIPPYYQKAGLTDKEIDIQHLRNVFDNSKRPVEWAETTMSGLVFEEVPRTIEAMMYDRAGAILIQDIVGPLYRDGEPNWDEAAKNYVQELKLVKNPKYNRTHHSNINFQEEGESDEDYYLRLIKEFEDFLTSAVTGDIAFSFIEATEEVMEEEKKEDKFGLYTPPLGDEWHPRDLAFVRDSEASAKSYLADSMNGKFDETNSGYLWNLTRQASGGSSMTGGDAVRWNVILRKLGIGGIVDDRGTGHIHSAEPEQAVFFAKADPEKNVELIKVFPNTHTKKKIKRRRMTGVTQDLRNIIKLISSEIHPQQNFRIDTNLIDGVVQHIAAFYDDSFYGFGGDGTTESATVEALRELKNSGYRILHDYYVRSYAQGSFKELNLMADEILEKGAEVNSARWKYGARQEINTALGLAESQLNYYLHSLTTSDQIVNKIMDEDKGAAKIRSMIVQKFEKIDDIVQDFKEIATDSLESSIKNPGEDEDRPSTWKDVEQGPGTEWESKMADLFEDTGEKKTKSPNYLGRKWDWIVE
jgi:hypothetical protein